MKTLKRQAPFGLIEYDNGYYGVDYSDHCIGYTILFTEDKEAAFAKYELLITGQTVPLDTDIALGENTVKLVKQALTQDGLSIYDIWDDNDGNLAYAFTNIPSDKMDELEVEYKSIKDDDPNYPEWDDSEKYNTLEYMNFLRGKGYLVFTVNRPSLAINLNQYS